MFGLLAVIIIHSTPFDEVAQGPSLPKNQQEFSLEEGATISVTSFNFSGNKAIPTSELQPLVAPYENSDISESDLQEIENRIKSAYLDKGYANVQVSIPVKQQSGSLTIMIKEGKKSS